MTEVHRVKSSVLMPSDVVKITKALTDLGVQFRYAATARKGSSLSTTLYYDLEIEVLAIADLRPFLEALEEIPVAVSYSNGAWQLRPLRPADERGQALRTHERKAIPAT